MIIPFLKGLATTLRMVFTKPITQQYPEEKREMYPRWRGQPQLTIDPDGRRRCVACTLCMVVCPSNAIRGIVAAEGPEHEKYPVAVHHRLAALHLLRPVPGGLSQGGHQAEQRLRTGPGR